VSRDGQRSAADAGSAAAVFVATFPMAAGSRFDWHTHLDHQLAWAANGVLIVLTDAATWVLPPTRALWIPAGLRHETVASGAATMRSLYIRPDLCAVSWPDPTPVAARQLLVELVGYLDNGSLDLARRGRAEELLVDLLEPVPLATIEVRLPTDERARDVAAHLGVDPADNRTLSEWGREVGASERTLARAVLADTGMPFGRWRTMLRLQAALPGLAAREPVGSVARRIGYDSSSAFVAAFRRETGLTPAAFFQPAEPASR
jgi:AraC-like DNA-binding protein/quercetin dioxygenase-like cupin family protein